MPISSPIPIDSAPPVPSSSTPEEIFDDQYQAFNTWEKDKLQPGINAIAANVFDNATDAAASAAAVAGAIDGTGADRVQTGLDAAATDADRIQTGLDRGATGADRIQTELDRVATGEDRIAVNSALSSIAGGPVASINGETGVVTLKTINSAPVTGTGNIVIDSSVYRSARTSNTALTTTDKGKLIEIISGTFTQTFVAAATLGDGWWCYIKNSGAGVITLDPNGSEQIDAGATSIVYSGDVLLIQCNGSGFNSLFKVAVQRHEVVAATGNGWGSTNTRIRRFTTLRSSLGNAISYADSATLGATFTINAPGFYAITYVDGRATPGGTGIGISLNSSQLSTEVDSITASERLAFSMGESTGYPNIALTVATLTYLQSGDVVRPHFKNNNPDGIEITSFKITKVML